MKTFSKNNGPDKSLTKGQNWRKFVSNKLSEFAARRKKSSVLNVIKDFCENYFQQNKISGKTYSNRN